MYVNKWKHNTYNHKLDLTQKNTYIDELKNYDHFSTKLLTIHTPANCYNSWHVDATNTVIYPIKGGFPSQQQRDVSESNLVYLEQVGKQYYYIYRYYAVVKTKRNSCHDSVFLISNDFQLGGKDIFHSSDQKVNTPYRFEIALRSPCKHKNLAVIIITHHFAITEQFTISKWNTHPQFVYSYSWT